MTTPFSVSKSGVVSTRQLVLGIDPGLTGALVLLNVRHSTLVEVRDMPVLNGGVDVRQLVTFISYHADQIRFAVVEKVGAMTYVDGNGQKRGQGAAASFNFGFGAGLLHGVLAACLVPFFVLEPSVWKTLSGLDSNKDLSRQKATEHYPKSAHLFTRKKDDGRAEAALLAKCGVDHFIQKKEEKPNAQPQNIFD